MIRSWEESCVSINDQNDNVIIVDKNIYIDNNIDKPYIPIEWIGAFILIGCLICGGIIFIYFRLTKPGVTKVSRDNKEVKFHGNEQNGNQEI